MINDIRADTNNVKVSSADKKVFNDLNELITEINNNKFNEENAFKKWKKVYLI